MSDAPAIFRARGLSKNFGGVRAVKDVSLAVAPATVFAIIGPNGAGKSTLLNLISGVHPSDAGTVTFDRLDVTRLPPHARVRHGLARTFQKIRLFKQLSVLDNVVAGFHSAQRHLRFEKLDRITAIDVASGADHLQQPFE